VAFYAFRAGGELLAVGAIKELDASHDELKSMHTSEAARGRGIGRRMVDHLLAVAAERGYARVSIETGTSEGFAAARALYAGAGFDPCGPFGDYLPSPNSAFMTRSVAAGGGGNAPAVGRRRSASRPSTSAPARTSPPRAP
jgi:putative acetyltransferase